MLIVDRHELVAVLQHIHGHAKWHVELDQRAGEVVAQAGEAPTPPRSAASQARANDLYASSATHACMDAQHLFPACDCAHCSAVDVRNLAVQ